MNKINRLDARTFIDWEALKVQRSETQKRLFYPNQMDNKSKL